MKEKLTVGENEIERLHDVKTKLREKNERNLNKMKHVKADHKQGTKQIYDFLHERNEAITNRMKSVSHTLLYCIIYTISSV